MNTCLPDNVYRQILDLVDRTIAGSMSNESLAMANADTTIKAKGFVETMNRYLVEYPGNTDLLLLKASALRLAAQEHAGPIVAGILARAPDHFDARMMLEDWDTWPHVLQLPPCAETMQRLPAPLVEGLRQGCNVQLIRDGLVPGVAFFQDISEIRFDHGLSNTMPCQWDFVPADTPFGRIVAHYVLVEDNVAKPYRKEFFLPTGKPQRAHAASGYWLLQRLARQESALILLAKGALVLYVCRYAFPPATRDTLTRLGDQLKRDPRPTGTLEDFQRAVQWHTDQFDFASVKFHAAPVSTPAPPAAPAPSTPAATADSMCELCGRPWSWACMELVSYYDLTDMQRGIDSATGALDVKQVFPFLRTYDNWERQKGPSDDWRACAECHHRVRRVLGRSEYKPRFYTGLGKQILSQGVWTDIEPVGNPSQPLHDPSPTPSAVPVSGSAENLGVASSGGGHTSAGESASARLPPTSAREASAFGIAIPIMLALFVGLLSAVVQWGIELFTGWQLDSYLVRVHGAVLFGALLAAVLFVPFVSRGASADKMIPVAIAFLVALLGAGVGGVVALNGWADQWLGSFRAVQIPQLLAQGFGLHMASFAERAVCGAVAVLLVVGLPCIVGVVFALTSMIRSPVSRLGMRLVSSILILAGAAALCSISR
jgi:hypothetical protein